MAVAREQLQTVLGRLVGAEQAVIGVEAAAIDRLCQKVVKGINGLGAGPGQIALDPAAVVDVGNQHFFGIGQRRSGVVGQIDLDLSRRRQFFVQIDIIDAGERMLGGIAEHPAIFRFGQEIGMRVDSPFVHQIHVHQLVADFVGRVVQKQMDFLAALRDPLEDQRKAVPAQNREQQGDFPGKLLVDVFGDRRNRRVISLRPCDDGFGDADHITVTILKAVLCGGV